MKGLKSTVGVDVIVHIGMPKTGSSAIQRFCLNNRDALLRAGLYYPKHAVDTNGVSGGHSMLARALRHKERRKVALRFKWMLLKAKLLRKTLLLSSEGFARAATEFSPLLEGLEVRVIGWFRHPVEYFISGYNQSVKRGFMANTLSERLPDYLKRGGLNQGAKRLARWADRVGDDRCYFLPYGKMGEPIERQWLRMIGVCEGRWGEFAVDAKRINRSYVPQALELKRLLNRVLTREDDQLAKRIDWALQEFSDQADESEASLGLYLDPEEIVRLTEHCAGRNEQLAQRFPALAPILQQSKQYLAQRGVDGPGQALDLAPVLAHLARSCPDDIVTLNGQAQALEYQPISDGQEAADIGRIAELLRVYNGQEFQ